MLTVPPRVNRALAPISMAPVPVMEPVNFQFAPASSVMVVKLVMTETKPSSGPKFIAAGNGTGIDDPGAHFDPQLVNITAPIRISQAIHAVCQAQAAVDTDKPASGATRLPGEKEAFFSEEKKQKTFAI